MALNCMCVVVGGGNVLQPIKVSRVYLFSPQKTLLYRVCAKTRSRSMAGVTGTARYARRSFFGKLTLNSTCRNNIVCTVSFLHSLSCALDYRCVTAPSLKIIGNGCYFHWLKKRIDFCLYRYCNTAGAPSRWLVHSMFVVPWSLTDDQLWDVLNHKMKGLSIGLVCIRRYFSVAI